MVVVAIWKELIWVRWWIKRVSRWWAVSTFGNFPLISRFCNCRPDLIARTKKVQCGWGITSFHTAILAHSCYATPPWATWLLVGFHCSWFFVLITSTNSVRPLICLIIWLLGTGTFFYIYFIYFSFTIHNRKSRNRDIDLKANKYPGTFLLGIYWNLQIANFSYLIHQFQQYWLESVVKVKIQYMHPIHK